MTEHAVRNAVQDDRPAAPMVRRAFQLLDLLAAAEDGLTLSALARALHMSKGSLHGLLKTLEGEAVVEATDDRRYVLGPHLFELVGRRDQDASLRRHALPPMRQLAAAIGETVCLGRVERDGVRILERVEPPADQPRLRISAECDMLVPLLAGALGRVVLASWTPARREEYLRARPLPSFTERSITDPARYLDAVAETARTGVAVEREEYLRGVSAIGAPVHAPDGTLLAVLWAMGFSPPTDDALERAGEQVRATATALSRVVAGEQAGEATK